MFKAFADIIVYNWLALNPETQLGASLHFFVMDFIQILIMIIIIMHIMSLVRYYLPIEKLRDFLAKNKLYGLDYFFATLFGAITPFCSCSSIPLFIGFIKAGIPTGITFAFLITSPLINEIAITLFWATFGIKITLIYIGISILIGILGGMFINFIGGEKYLADFVKNNKNKLEKEKISEKQEKFKTILKKVNKEAIKLTKEIVLYLAIGIGIGAFIHGYVPEGYFDGVLKTTGIFGVPLATVLAVPLYADAVSVIPIMQALVAKGVPIGTAISFMMAVVGLSLPQALILKKVMQIKLLVIFFFIITLGIILVGYLLNLLI